MKNLLNKYGKNKAYGSVYVLVVLIVAIVCGTIYFMNENKDKLIIKDEVVKIELGKGISLKPVNFLSADMDKQDVDATVLKTELMTDKEKYTFDEKKFTVTSKDKEYLEVGKYKINLELYDEKATVTLLVADTTAPKFKGLKKEIKVEQNAKDVDFVKYFEAEDLSKVIITVNNKEVDLTNTGEYKLTVIAEDEYKNKIESEVKVSVVSLEEAEKGGVTEMLDGTKPISKELEKKKAEAKKRKNTNNASTENKTVTPPSNNGNRNNGSTNNGSNGNTTPQQPTEPVYRKDLSNDCMKKINAWRQQNGVPALQHSAELQSIADKRVLELINDYSHNGSITGGENIAMCYGYNGQYQDFFTIWKNSPGHNKNQLSPGYETFAVSIINVSGKWYGVTVFHRTDWVLK